MCKNKDELNKLVEKRRELTAKRAKIDEKLKEVNADIIDYVTAKGELGGKDNKTLIVIGDGYKISYITITKKEFDAKKLEEFFGENSINYKKITTYPRLDIR